MDKHEKIFNDLKHSQILARALALINEMLAEGRIAKKYFDHYRKAAFANSIAYLLTGASGGYGGPSMREHACSAYRSRVKNKEMSETDMIDLCLSLCFGPMTKEIAIFYNDHHFDDPEGDLEAAQRILGL